MEIVSQITPYTCTLACFESYFHDLKRPLKQEEILRKHPQYCLNPHKIDIFGTMTEVQIICFARLFGIETTPYIHIEKPSFIKLVKELSANDAIFITSYWKEQTYHCVRFSRIIDESKGLFEVMSPAFRGGSMEQVDFNELVKWNFTVFLFKRIQAD